MEREEIKREAFAVTDTVIEVVKELCGTDLKVHVVPDILDNMDPKPLPKRNRYVRSGRERAHQRRAALRTKQKEKLDADERKLSALKIRLLAGDTNAPQYKIRLAHAKRSIRIATALPVIARQKWGNPKFQKEMEEKGFAYDLAKYKGWLPFEDAKALQQKVIKARSRAEYEFLNKLFEIRFLPARPDRVYEEDWKGWSDYLGVLNVFGTECKRSAVAASADYRPFYEALTFVRTLKLTSVRAWTKACKAGLVPLDIPMDPHNVYPDQFVDIAHWLGNSSAAQLVKGEVVVEQVWVLYTDGRTDCFWWAKMSSDKYKEFISIPEIQLIRTYAFEGELATSVWAILDRYSTVYEEDQRERYVSRPADIALVGQELDAILEWKMV